MTRGASGSQGRTQVPIGELGAHAVAKFNKSADARTQLAHQHRERALGMAWARDSQASTSTVSRRFSALLPTALSNARIRHRTWAPAETAAKDNTPQRFSNCLAELLNG